MDDSINDNEAERTAATGPDAHGQAALLLVESLIHVLIARRVLCVSEAIEVVEVAGDVKREIAADLGDSPATLRRSLALLEGIARSLGNDLDGDSR